MREASLVKDSDKTYNGNKVDVKLCDAEDDDDVMVDSILMERGKIAPEFDSGVHRKLLCSRNVGDRIVRFSDVEVGDYVEVFWKGDLVWYLGKVRNIHPQESGALKIYVSYDDCDDGELLDSNSEIWRKLNIQSKLQNLMLNVGVSNSFKIYTIKIWKH